MNDQNFINFKKNRDLGAMLSDTFKFLAIEWKPFFGTILKTSIIPILIAVCAMVYYAMSSLDFFGDFIRTTDFETILSRDFSELSLAILVLLISYLISYAIITSVALAYIKSYIDNKGVVSYQEIQNSIKDKFWPFVGLFLLVGIIVGFGFIFCFIPGLYFGVVLSLSYCLLIFRDKGVLDAISDSFSFIKEHWWETFGILLVVQIIVTIISYISDLPASIYLDQEMVLIAEEQDATKILSLFSDPIYITLIMISYFVRFVLYILTTIVAVFVFFDIKEQKNPSSDMIDEIGIS